MHKKNIKKIKVFFVCLLNSSDNEILQQFHDQIKLPGY